MREDAGGTGSVSLEELDVEDGMNAHDWFHWKNVKYIEVENSA